MGLAVDVGLGNMVHVQQADLPHAGAGQGLCDPGADTAYTDDGDVAALNPLGRCHPVQAL